MELNFEQFYDYVRNELNLDLNAYKEKQLQRRITTVMKSSGVSTLEDYSKLITRDEAIRTKFLDYITINVTEFFRNKDIFTDFETILTNSLIPKFKDIKIWSAACSIGAEPYSLAIILDKNNIRPKEKIVATDVDDKILARAKIGAFKDFEIKNLDKKDLDKYFTEKDNKYYINNNIKNMVSFKKHDLILDNYERGFHAIICRNVTIYFKSDAKDEIYRKFNESLVKGGVLFTGATETIYNPIEFGFKKISTFIYEKI
jgi:chemotaxis protein methyltransferase CheR